MNSSILAIGSSDRNMYLYRRIEGSIKSNCNSNSNSNIDDDDAENDSSNGIYRPNTANGNGNSNISNNNIINKSNSNSNNNNSNEKCSYVRQAVCQGHAGVVEHIDFSSNNQYLSSCCSCNVLLFWDIRGNSIKNSSFFKDEQWASGGIRSTPYGWAVQGIASEGAVNSLVAMPAVGDIVVGGNDGSIKLYRYPCLSTDSLSQGYCGHAGPVAKVRVSNSKRWVASIGSQDRTLLLWKHEVELQDDSCSDSDDSDDDDGGVGMHAYTILNNNNNNNNKHELINASSDIPNEVPEIVIRSILQEAVATNENNENIQKIIKDIYNQRGENVSDATRLCSDLKEFMMKFALSCLVLSCLVLPCLALSVLSCVVQYEFSLLCTSTCTCTCIYYINCASAFVTLSTIF